MPPGGDSREQVEHSCLLLILEEKAERFLLRKEFSVQNLVYFKRLVMGLIMTKKRTFKQKKSLYLLN